MSVLAGPFAVAAAVLAVGGALKLVHPADTAVALRIAGARVGAGAVRAGAAAELLLAAGALATGGRVAAAAVAVSYAGFTAFVAVALARKLPLSSCGCLGGIDTPPTWLHVAINAGMAVTSAAVAVRGVPPITDVLGEQPLGGIPFLALVGLGTWLVIAALTELPRTRQAAARGLS